MRLIDAGAYEFPGDLVNEPTIDAVEVVRCKDCKHCTIYRCRADNGIKQLKCKFGLDIGDENHYCSLGAKMDGKGDEE